MMQPESDPLDLVASARRLAPRINAAREEMERLRHIPAQLADALADAGLYRMYLPDALGGFELEPRKVFEVIEEVSKADASVGWCLMNANGMTLGAAWLTPEVGLEMFGQPPNIRASGSFRLLGRAWPVEGGYKVEGRWNFASGVRNANWLHCPCVVMDGDAPRLGPTGAPVARTMWIAVSDATLVDTWSVMGMRGTGSDDFAVENLVVPAERAFTLADAPVDRGPLYRPRLFLTLVHLLFAANALGLARGAIQTLIDMASRDASSLSPVLLRDRAPVQGQVAQAHAIVSAARCYVIDALTRFWAVVVANMIDPIEAMAELRLAIPHAINESVRAVDLVFRAAGTNANFLANPLERQFRDIHAAAQHYAAFPIHYESVGKVMMGLRPSEPGW
jgi:alkylation response protein AidB-like acyl-CoA dehydrogenase